MLIEKLKKGFAFHAAGYFDKAKEVYQEILINEPNHFDTLQLLGAIAIQEKKWGDALILLMKAVSINPNHAHALCNCGIVFKALHRHDEALLSYEKAIAIKGDYAEAYYNRGILLNELNRLADALESYSKAIEFKTDYAEAYYNQGMVLQKLNQMESALASYDKAIILKPDYPECHSNRGILLNELQRMDEALISFNRAIELKYDSAEAYYNRGKVLHEPHQMQEALSNYDKAIELNNNYAEAHHNKALSLLLIGDFIEGFMEYEWRWFKKTSDAQYIFSKPLWHGHEDLNNKTIFLWSEQGLGDTLQFCRYAKLVSALGARVILGIQKPLFNLLQNLEGIDEFIAKDSLLPEFDFHCPLMSLPLAFKTTVDTIPNQVPYLNSNINKQLFWRNHIGEHGFKIAICWQGSTHAIDKGRSFPVSLFEGLSKIEGVRLISLQKNEGVEQLDALPAGMHVERLPDEFDSGENAFLDSAAVMKCVDLVITSDTALTHLGGALGVKTWLPLKYVPDWRWMLNRSDSPWYPNHRLFRQTTRDEWTSVFAEMENEVKIILSIEELKIS